MRKEEREGGRCAEVSTNWPSGATLNRREKHKKAGAIKEEKDVARYDMRELGNDFGVFFKPSCFQKKKLKDAS